jgi:hypothetical protein
MPPGKAFDDVMAELRHQATLVPQVAGRLSNVFLNADSMLNGREVNGYFQAIYRDGKYSREIHMSGRVFREGNAAEQLHSEITGFKTSCGQQHTSGQSVFAHEFGHHLDYLVRDDSTATEIKELWGTISDVVGVDPPTHIGELELQQWFSRNKQAISERISGYASTNRNEFIAEIWREYSGNPNARPGIKKIGALLHKLARGVQA